MGVQYFPYLKQVIKNCFANLDRLFNIWTVFGQGGFCSRLVDRRIDNPVDRGAGDSQGLGRLADIAITLFQYPLDIGLFQIGQGDDPIE